VLVHSFGPHYVRTNDDPTVGSVFSQLGVGISAGYRSEVRAAEPRHGSHTPAANVACRECA